MRIVQDEWWRIEERDNRKKVLLKKEIIIFNVFVFVFLIISFLCLYGDELEMR